MTIDGRWVMPKPPTKSSSSKAFYKGIIYLAIQIHLCLAVSERPNRAQVLPTDMPLLNESFSILLMCGCVYSISTVAIRSSAHIFSLLSPCFRVICKDD